MLKKIILSSIILILFTVLIWLILNPLFMKERKIRDNLLKTIPMSTNMDEALQLIKKNKEWEIRNIDYDDGFYFNSYSGFPENGEDRVIGEKHIRVYLGSYFIIVEIPVIAYFAFDKNDKLIEIYVGKQPDGP
jgi:hypothetical protein